jgi:hypothetical protein|tara:strand:- start:2781 stop:3047 length:267 start_codon:yes stop_codon:yes gene_type:complete
MNKSKEKIAQDYSRNAIADSKSSSASVKKDGKYEAKMAVEESAGEGPKMKGKSPLKNQNKGYDSNKKESPITSKPSGSWMSKHVKGGM